MKIIEIEFLLAPKVILKVTSRQIHYLFCFLRFKLNFVVEIRYNILFYIPVFNEELCWWICLDICTYICTCKIYLNMCVCVGTRSCKQWHAYLYARESVARGLSPDVPGFLVPGFFFSLQYAYTHTGCW